MNTTWITIIVISQVVWLWALVSLLNNDECNPTDKICWTIVLCLLNVVGTVLYLFVGPKEANETQSEEELKRAFNEGRR
jgi:4-amino-4-deoxy-L-arabinose transferase-like glycosyltransferase